MSTQTTKQLLDLHGSLYQKAYVAAHAFPNINSPKLRHYAKNYHKMLPSHFTLSDEQRVVRQALESDVFIYGDFHTLKQTQRGLLRILRELALTAPEPKRFVLALEMFNTNHQKSVDQFVDGKLSVDDFKKAINYDKTWGFPWGHFFPILEFAQTNKIKIYALNPSNKKTRSTLAGRDEFIANEIVRIKKSEPNSLVVTMIGEYHLADEHLPRQLKQKALEQNCPMQIMRLLNNVDQYYFSLLKSGNHLQQSEYLQLSSDMYCVINTPAWMKWRSLANWEEMSDLAPRTRDQIINDYDSVDDEFQNIDLDHQFFEITSHLVKFFGLTIEPGSLQKIHFLMDLDTSLLNRLKRKYKLTTRDISSAIEKSERDGAYYFPQEHTVLIRHINLNCLAKVAGEHIQNLHAAGPTSNNQSSAFRFYRSILKVAAGALSIKILNPKRKVKKLDEYRAFVRQTQKRKLSGDMHKHQELSRMIIDHQKWIDEKISTEDSTMKAALAGIYNFDERSQSALSTAIGELLGNELGLRLLSDEISIQLVAPLFTESVNNINSCWMMYLSLTQLTNKSKKNHDSIAS